MPVFLKRLRRAAAAGGRLRRVAAYVAGELLLIVAGILAALAISAYQRRAALRETEADYRAALVRQLSVSQRRLDTLVATARASARASRALLSAGAGGLDCPRASVLTAITFDLDYRPLDATVRELTASGELHRMFDDDLRRHLYAWEAGVAGVRRQEEQVRGLTERIAALLIEAGAEVAPLLFATDAACGLSPANAAAFGDPRVESWLAVYAVTLDALVEYQYGYVREELSATLALLGGASGEASRAAAPRNRR